MALKMISATTDEEDVGFALFDEWSAGSEAKYHAREVPQQWRSFKTDFAEGIGIGSLFYLARSHGWVRPAPDVSSLFQNIQPTITPAELSQTANSYVPRLNLELMPKALTARAVEIATRVGCEPVIPIWAGLAAASAAADARSRLELAPDYKVPPVIWLITLGDPAAKKSPGSKPMFEVLHEIEDEDLPLFRAELAKWEAKEAGHTAAKKAYLAQAAQPLNLLSNGEIDLTALPTVHYIEDRPESKRLVVGDITSQKLIDLASSRPYGMLANYDELGATLRKMTDPRSGDNRGTWISGFEGGRYLLDRIGSGTTVCENFAVSIYGNCQPAVLAGFSKEASTDGLLQRFLFAPIKQENQMGRPTPHRPEIAAAYESAIRNIHAVGKMNYRLSPAGARLFEQFQARYCQMINDDRCLNMGNTYLGAVGKLEGQCGRLIFLFHLLENPHQQEVAEDTVRRAVAFTEGYVVSALRHVLAEDDFRSGMLNFVSEWIITNDRETFEIANFRSDLREKLEIPSSKMSSRDLDDELMMVAESLINTGWISQIDTKPARWAVNPAVRERYAAYRNNIIRLRHERHKMMMLDLRANYPDSESVKKNLARLLEKESKMS